MRAAEPCQRGVVVVHRFAENNFVEDNSAIDKCVEDKFVVYTLDLRSP